jgi:tetratricopeptide (TPR) repeat protein
LERAGARAQRTCARALAFGLALTLTSATALASLGAPAADPAAAQAEAEAMFRRGQAKYETADYNGAIELWTEAYNLVGSIPDNAAIQALLIYNLAQAHIKAFELDEDRIHLKQAEQLLRSFEANLETVYEDPEQIAAEQAKIDEALADIAARSTTLEDKGQTEPEPDGEDPAESPGAVPENLDPLPPEPGKPAKPLLIAGGVLAGVGLGVGAVAIVGIVQARNANFYDDLDPLDYDAREQRFASGQRANTLIVVGSVGAGVLVTTGVALLVVGAMRSKQARQTTTAARPILAPSFGPAGAGLSVSGRF